MWGLGNISGDSAACRDAILNSGGLEPLADLVENSDDEKIIKHGTWALSNLTRGKPAPEFSKVYRAIPVLEKVLMELKDEDALVDAAWALSHLSDGAKERIDIVLQTDIGPALKRLLEYKLKNNVHDLSF